MVATGKALRGIGGKTIVLTGALQPAAFKSSDAIFNIGCAIGALQVADFALIVIHAGDGVGFGTERMWRPQSLPEGLGGWGKR